MVFDVHLNMEFDWDPKKAAINILLGKPPFEEGVLAWKDPNAVIRFDPAHSHDEDRFHLIGYSPKRILLVVFTMRENDALTWIISVRKATPMERRTYEQKREN